jgi:hypothetical protein
MSAPTISENDWLGDATASPVRPAGGRPAKGYRGRQRKLSCPLCGFIAYATAGALTRAGVPVCGCGEPMVLANIRDSRLRGMGQARGGAASARRRCVE